MKRFCITYILLAVGLLVALPLVWNIAVKGQTSVGEDAAPQSAPADLQQQAAEPTVRVYLSESGQVAQYPLEEAVARVVAAEVPASFPPAALEAQAIVARTYILNRLPQPYGAMAKHSAEQADICDDYNHCQAFYSGQTLAERWPDDPDSLAKVETAVEATRGQVLESAGALIDPVYHSTCGGRTEAAVDCWQSDVPALQSVSCGFDTDAPRFSSCLVFSSQQLAQKLGIDLEHLEQLAVQGRSQGNRVVSVTAGEQSWSGREVRELLGLNSANFEFVKEGDNWLFTVLGFGHGVGLCQYGAKGMAEAGYSAQEILCHYYQDVEVAQQVYSGN